VRLVRLCIDANDPLRIARFWAGALGWDLVDEDDAEVLLVPTDGTRFAIAVHPATEQNDSHRRMHFDLSSASPEAQQATVQRLLDLGARHVDIGQGPDATHVVLADPEGNACCVLEAGNRFVDYGGLLGSITCDGAGPSVGHFWSEALGWPLVWDQDDETAIRAPDGTGQFITWGPPLPPKTGKNRVHLDVAPAEGGDQQAAVARLLALGARTVDIGQGDVPWIVLADPDGNEFCVLASG
jgi:catechol 2,3-dioxygenase-like lactoylglutathione lyase family enzyme